MDISYFFRYLWRKKWVILIPTALALILSWFLTRNMQSSYTSVAELSTGYIATNPLDNRPIQNNTVLFNNVIQTLKSNRNLDQVTYRLLLHDLTEKSAFRIPEDRSHVNRLLSKYPGGKAGFITSLSHKVDSFHVLDLSVENDRMIRRLAGLYGYDPDALLGFAAIYQIHGSDFIRITTTTEDPKLSAFISNNICKSFLAYYQDVQGQTSASSLQRLKNIVDEKKKILDNKVKMLQGSTDLTATSAVGLLTNLQSQLTQQRQNLIAAQVALDNVNKQINENDKQGGLANNEDIISLRNNMDNLYEKYINGGSNDANLLQQINKLRAYYQQKLTEIGNVSSGIPMGDLIKQKMDLEIKANVAKRTMQDLQSKINTLSGAVQSSASKEGLIAEIQNEIDAARQEFLNAKALYNEAMNQNIFPGNNFKQTLVASPPLYPNASKRLKIMGFIGAGVFCSLIFFLLFFEFIDPGIKTPSNLKENIALPLISSVPHINIGRGQVFDLFSANGSLPERKKIFRDDVKQLRFEVERSGKKIFLITGYHDQSGRTTIAEALASTLSLKGKKVLLVDANFRNNTLTRRYNGKEVLENFEALGDKQAINVSIKEAATPTSDENIQVIGCSSSDHTPDEALPQKNILSHLKQDTAGYDYIFIDGAAIEQGPDSKELLKYTDAVILVFAADQPLTEEDKKLVKYLKGNGTETLGAVLNRVKVDNKTL